MIGMSGDNALFSVPGTDPRSLGEGRTSDQCFFGSAPGRSVRCNTNRPHMCGQNRVRIEFLGASVIADWLERVLQVFHGHTAQSVSSSATVSCEAGSSSAPR